MRGRITKVDMTARLMRHKTRMYNNELHNDWTADQKSAAQTALSEVLDMLSEYSV